jgi:hypothetical protein
MPPRAHPHPGNWPLPAAAGSFQVVWHACIRASSSPKPHTRAAFAVPYSLTRAPHRLSALDAPSLKPQIRKFLMPSPHPAAVKPCHRLLQRERTPQCRRRSPVLVRWPEAVAHDFQLARWCAEWGAGWIPFLLVATGQDPARDREAITPVHRVTERAPLKMACGPGLLSKWRPSPPSATCSLLSRPLSHSS